MKTTASHTAFGLGAALGLVVAFAPSCGSSTFTCDATSCSIGCCQNGQCLAGTAINSCGKGGGACVGCAVGQACSNQACGSTFTGGGQGGGSGGGGGTMPCNATTCASGCCSSSTSCETGATAAACGTGGATCSVCTSAQTCTAKACVANPVIDSGVVVRDAGTGTPDAGTGTADAGPTIGCNPTVVISQVYGGGGNSGATFNADYVEIHNRTGAAIDLTGWSLQYSSAAGTNWSVFELRTTVSANGFALIQTLDGLAVGAALTMPDQLPPSDGGTRLNMGASAGKLALVSNSTAITDGGVCANGLAVVDWVGWGTTAVCAEGGDAGVAAPAASNTTALFRKETTGTLACVDTNVSGADFVVAAPSPRNASTPASACTCQ